MPQASHTITYHARVSSSLAAGNVMEARKRGQAVDTTEQRDASKRARFRPIYPTSPEPDRLPSAPVASTITHIIIPVPVVAAPVASCTRTILGKGIATLNAALRAAGGPLKSCCDVPRDVMKGICDEAFLDDNLLREHLTTSHHKVFYRL